MGNNAARIEQEADIGLICLNKPPVNALGAELRSAVYSALQQLLENTEVKAIVLYGTGRFFSAGADINDFSRAAENPTLPEVLTALGNSPKPVIAAMHGIAFGGALELALSTQVRVGIDGLRIALPEVKLGLIPGAGGTQRLPRLTGLKAAVELICTGNEISASQALELGILQRLESGTAKQAGIRAARDCLDGKLTATPTDTLQVIPDQSVLQKARTRFAGKLSAPLRAIDALQASSLPIDNGLIKERALFTDLLRGTEHAGLVHAFRAERATAKIPEQNASTINIDSVGIVGGGTMGVGIATAFLMAGFPVTLIEMQQDRLQFVNDSVGANLSGALKRGKISGDSYNKANASLHLSTDLSELAEADLVIEAIFEELTAKKDLFQKLDQLCHPEAILATNTSYLNINKIAAATSRPENVIGLHFFSPAHIMRLLEIVVAAHTAPKLVATCFGIARQLNKVPVHSGVCEGFIGNRILSCYRKCTEYLLLDGATFEQIDKALEAFGFALGPFAVSDLAGLDIARAIRLRNAPNRPIEERYSRVADLICEEGWYGRKTGQGYYRYNGKDSPTPNPEVIEIIERERKVLNLKPRHFTDEDIVQRCTTAIICEATNVLHDGIALRPVDIDAVQLFGYGFPRHRGGPMLMADQTGITTLIARIREYASEDSYFWKVPPLLLEMKTKNQRFGDLNNNEVDART